MMTTSPMKTDSLPGFKPVYNSDQGAIFDGVIFELDTNIPSSEQSKIKKQLLDNGAKCYDEEKTNGESTQQPTHFITDQAKYKDGVHSVMPLWVKTGLRNGFVHDPKFYRPDPSKFLSGMVVTASGLPQRDMETIFGVATALGGQYRESLTSDVTHLICIAPKGDMYDEAMGPLLGKFKVILPHWIDECMKLRRLVPDEQYLFPDPPFYNNHKSITQTNDSNKPITTSSSNKQPEDMGVEPQAIDTSNTKYDDIFLTNSTPMVYPLPSLDKLKLLAPPERLFDGNLIYFHSDIGMHPDIYSCIVKLLEATGATVTNNYDETADRGGVITIFKYRNSALFRQSCKRIGVIVANLNWITNTLQRGRVESPLRSICDYPVPCGGIVGMKTQSATLTGYRGRARNVLFRMCAIVGLPCSLDFGVNTTLVICSNRETEKYRVAKRRQCHVVNHLWLEDCYQDWELKSVAEPRYTYFPPDNMLEQLVGTTPISENSLKSWLDENACPAVAPYVPSHLLNHSPRDSNDDSGSSRRRRQAALDADSQLRDVVIPDMNDYQKEQRSGNNHQNHIATTPTTTTVTKNDSTDTSIENRRRRPSHSPSDSSAHSAKRHKLNHMKSQSDSLEPTAPSPNTPSQLPKKSSKNTTPRQPSTKRSTQSSIEKSGKKVELTEDTEMEDTVSSADSKQKRRPSTSSADSKQQRQSSTSSAPSTFVFADNPSKIAMTSCKLTKDEEKGIRKLGGAIVEDILEADILVVPNRMLRTPKFLCAVNLGMTIVTEQWIKDSIINQAWCNSSEYQVKDPVMEKSYSFKLFDSLLSAQKANQQHGKGERHGDWLQGYEICVLPSAGSIETLKGVVETAGGKIVPVPKRRSQISTDSLLALGAANDKKRKVWKDLLEFGIKIYDKDLVITGTLRQKFTLDEFFLA